MANQTIDFTSVAQKRPLGNSGLQTAPIVLGGNVFGWTVNEAASFTILDAFLDAGFNMVDTANSYSKWAPGHRGGESETIIGKWLKQSKKRAHVLIATKIGSDMGPGNKGLSAGYILCEVEQSLKRLQTDYLDLYQSHFDDPDTPLDDTLEAYSKLIEQGKVRAIGASNYSPNRLQAALEVSRKRSFARYETLQPIYNLYDRSDFEGDLQRICIDNNLGVIPYFALASGFLTGKYRSAAESTGKARAQFVSKYFNDRGSRILDALDKVADDYDSTPTQVALAWLINAPGVTAPIASATNLDQLQDIMSAVALKLDHASTEHLNQAGEKQSAAEKLP